MANFSVFINFSFGCFLAFHLSVSVFASAWYGPGAYLAVLVGLVVAIYFYYSVEKSRLMYQVACAALIMSALPILLVQNCLCAECICTINFAVIADPWFLFLLCNTCAQFDDNVDGRDETPRSATTPRSPRWPLRSASQGAELLVAAGDAVLQAPLQSQVSGAAASSGGAFAPGEAIEYYSRSQGEWIPAKVLVVNADGTFNLNCKDGVTVDSIRKAVTKKALANGARVADTNVAFELSSGSVIAKAPSTNEAKEAELTERSTKAASTNDSMEAKLTERSTKAQEEGGGSARRFTKFAEEEKEVQEDANNEERRKGSSWRR